MAAWIEDAQVINDVKDLTRNKSLLLQRTADVDDFLSNVGSASLALIAPKGFGKTLLLKLKRISLQENGYRCIPSGVIVDRPKDRPPILPLDILDLMERSENWETLWQLSLSIALLKHYSDDQDVRHYLTDVRETLSTQPILRGILDNPLLDKPFEILHSLLGLSRSELFEALRQSSTFTSAYSRIHKNTAIFIDNIDEYLEYYINYEYIKRHELYQRYLRVWHNGQIGAWLALRRLNGVNPHVKVFVSVRKEAFHYAITREPLFSNLRGFAKELRYSVDDIRQIIDNNISSEPPTKLVDKNAKEPIRKFVGIENEFISNSGTGKQELFVDYWLRHCTLRPRDAIVIGAEISMIKPERRNKQAIRSAINNSSAQRVQSLFTEVSPFFEGLVPDVFPRLIPTNVLTLSDLQRVAALYYKTVSEDYGMSSESAQHPFCALYSIGLLGVVAEDRDRPGQLIQKFAEVGQVPLGSLRILPTAERYLLHPSFTDYIQGKNVGFIRRTNRQNVIGDGLEWRTEQEIRFVAIGDMKGYRSSIMNNVGASQTFQKFWSELFSSYTGSLDYASASGGDSILAADRSAARLIRAVRSVMLAIKRSNYNISIRVGLHSGFWRLNQDEEGVSHPEIADIVGVAARIEPHAHAGDMLLSCDFLLHAEQMGNDLSKEEVQEIPAEYFSPDLYHPDKGLLISKQKSELPDWLHVKLVKVNTQTATC